MRRRLLPTQMSWTHGAGRGRRFEAASLGEISCLAIVRNGIEGTGVGVEFLDIEGVEHRRIVAFVTKHQA